MFVISLILSVIIVFFCVLAVKCICFLCLGGMEKSEFYSSDGSKACIYGVDSSRGLGFEIFDKDGVLIESKFSNS